MLYKNKYYGITHFLGFLYIKNNFFYNIWKKIFCKRGIHLLDEVWSDDSHYLVCDACQLIVNIESIDNEYVKK